MAMTDLNKIACHDFRKQSSQLGTAFTPADWRAAAARRIWLAAEFSLIGTPADFYFRTLGIELSHFARVPRALRFHPELWNREAGRPLPAIVAAVAAPNGGFSGCHATWIDRSFGGSWRLACLGRPRLNIGNNEGGLVRLWRGISGRPIAKAGEGEPFSIVAGVERALRTAQEHPQLRIFASVSGAAVAGYSFGESLRRPAAARPDGAMANDAPGVLP